MDNDKNFNPDLDIPNEGESAPSESSAPRARNRTVMLTPEITGQVRARLAQDLGASGPPVRPSEPATTSSDFVSPTSGAFYTPGHRSRSSGAEISPVAPEPRGRPSSASSIVPQTDQREGLVWQKKTPVVGFLVSFDSNVNGDVYELRTGRLIITSESAGQGNYLLVRDESVSPMHAILRISQAGEVQVLDQLSEFGTRIRRFESGEEQELSGDKGTVEHGDIIMFGNRKFHVCMIAMPPTNG